VRFPFDERKAAQAAAYLLQKHGDQINYMKLIKLLYLADRKALLEAGQPITGDRMVSMPKGPVLTGILDLINWGKKRGQSSAWFEYVSEPFGYDVRLARTNITIEDLDRLSDFERDILDEIDEQYGRVDRWSLVELTHRLPEWRDPRGSSFPIDPADILREQGWSEAAIRRAAQDAERAHFVRDLDLLDIEAE
jgi:uncharacterized phage-associated protein